MTKFTKLTAFGRERFALPSYLSEFLLVMKMTLIIVLVACMQVSAKPVLGQTVSLSCDHMPLVQAFSSIEKQSGFRFIWLDEQMKDVRPVTLHVSNEPLSSVLEELFRGQPIGYRVDVREKVIVVEKRSEVIENNSNGLFVPEKTGIDIEGKILNEEGQPLEGASVVLKGAKKGTASNINGEFSIKGAPIDAVLIVSYVGYEVSELKLEGRKSVSITLRHGANELDQTVIKGYYSTIKRLNTGDISTVTSKEIQEQPVSDPLLALEGRVPGLYIQQSSGVPGAYSTVRIMGQNSIANGNDPLYVIDGVPFSSISLTSTAMGGGAVGSPSNGAGQGMSPFNALNPADIESIEILKDADATAIYGSRGANGVILITTKKGRAGNTKVDVNVYSGYGRVTRIMDLLNTSQYLEMRHEALFNDGLTPGSSDYDLNGVWDTTRYTNWQKDLIENPNHFTNVQLNISGGNSNIQFSIGGSYNTQGTSYPGNFADKKASAHFNITSTSNDQRFHVQWATSYVNDNNNIPTEDLTNFISIAPDAPALYNANGSINWQLYNGAATWNNPIVNVFNPSAAITDNLISNLNLSYELLKGLQLKSSFGFSHDQMNQTQLSPATILEPPPYNLSQYSSIVLATTDFQTWIIEPQVYYKKIIGQGRLEILMGSTFQQNIQNSQSAFGNGFTNDALINDPVNAFSTGISSKQYTLYHYDALFGRIGYTLQDKYLINFTARRDGSSRFGPGKQFGNFGALGLGWIFTKEKWVETGLPFISYGKLRTSYGMTGNDQISDYQYLSTYSGIPNTYQGITGLYPSNLTNPNYSWEVVKKFQIGLDLGFIKDKILISGIYYRNQDDNQLVGYPLPSITGFTSVQANLPAIVQNSGLEFILNTINVQSRNFTWSSSINVTIPKNKLEAFPGLPSSSYANQYLIGKSLFIIRSFHEVGVNDTTGVYEYQTSKGGVTNNPAYPQDLTATPEITQQYFGGFRNSIQYKGLQLDIFFQFVKQTGYNVLNQFYPGYFGNNRGNIPAYFLDRWRGPGDITNVGKFSTENQYDPNGAFGFSDYVISDASFIRLKNLALSYSLPLSWQQRAHLQSARVYLQGQNLFTITKYIGLDPETRGLALPPLRMLVAGIQVVL
jgi:TonB-linked SusC/RagA family outer membrane protein